MVLCLGIQFEKHKTESSRAALGRQVESAVAEKRQEAMPTREHVRVLATVSFLGLADGLTLHRARLGSSTCLTSACLL